MSETYDWTHPDLAFLAKQLIEGNVVLFVGAGFSIDAVNALEASPPLASGLATILAKEACMEYRGEPLALVYAAARTNLGASALLSRLHRYYHIKEYADWYKIVRTTTWHRIYTTNIDDLLQLVYSDRPKGVQVLDTIVCPSDYRERAEDFRSVQCVYLHGSIQDESKPLTFTLSELASQSARANPWYQSLVDELCNRTVLFVGASLSDSPFYHYLECRKSSPGRPSRPAKSFLVAPDVTPIQRRHLEELNIVSIDATASAFFRGLERKVPQVDRSTENVLARALPAVSGIEALLGKPTRLSRHFTLVVRGKLPVLKSTSAGMFFLGAEPTWDDIEKGRDGLREITSSIVASLSAELSKFSCTVLYGPAGSGKTTTAMRAALLLSLAGETVLFARNEGGLECGDLPALASKLSVLGKRLFVIIDVFSQQLKALSSVELVSVHNLTLLLVDRTNAYASRQQAVEFLKPTEVAMPDLSRADAEAVVGKLAEFGFLGELRTKSRAEQIELFMDQASRQLLVALREATSGRRFDLILKDELDKLDEAAQLAYVMCSLAVAQGAPGVYRRHLMAALSRKKGKKSVIFDESLRDVLVPANQAGTLLKPRHRMIGQLVARQLSSTDMRMEATIALLLELSGDITPGEISRRSPAYLAYRGLINSDALCELFGGDGVMPLKVYDAVRSAYDGDFLFWVQYSMAHVRMGNLDVAENFIRQSLAIRANNFQAMHQLGIVYLMQAAIAPNPGAMIERANEGIVILREQIISRGDSESHPYGAYMTYVSRWYLAARDLITDKEWGALRATAREALGKYSLDDVIRDADREVQRSYLLRAVKKSAE